MSISDANVDRLWDRDWSFCVPLTLLAFIVLAAVYFARVKIR
jgi:hypothetical protein